MRLAIIGSRDITEFDMETILFHLPKKVEAILSGGAKGVDSLAEEFARRQGIPFLKVLPNYPRYGKKAPIMRNLEIVRQADYLLAIWDYKSRGTAHAIACCIREGVPVRILNADGAPVEPDPRLFEL